VEFESPFRIPAPAAFLITPSGFKTESSFMFCPLMAE
jgi:hypothetical protein